MDSATSPDPFPTQLKFLVAGGFGVGKTTLVGSVSEIKPLTTEELLTTASVPTDDLAGVEGKTTTTVAMDFGRITLSARNRSLVLLLFGTPGQERFWFMWDELCTGALGALVLADTRRLADCFGSVEFFERRRVPFVVALNEFPDGFQYDLDTVRAALRLQPNVPLVRCDARHRGRSLAVLYTLVQTVHQALVAKRAPSHTATRAAPAPTHQPSTAPPMLPLVATTAPPRAMPATPTNGGPQ